MWWFSGFEQVGTGLITGGSLVLRESTRPPLRHLYLPWPVSDVLCSGRISRHPPLLAHLWPTITAQEGRPGAASRVKEGPVDRS